MKKNSKRFQIENNVLIRCNKDARKVVIPEEVTEIGDYAFYCCFNLVSVTIPKGVKRIGKKAFFGCGLTRIIIPTGVTEIGAYAFEACTSLKSVVIPDSVTRIGNYAFCACRLKSVIIPDSVTEIGYRAFESCTSLTNVVFPDTVSKIGSFPFYHCKINELHSKCINITNGLCIEGKKILYCSDRSLTSIIIPDGISEIGEKAFAGLNLRKVTIPNSVTKIGDKAFCECARKSGSEIIGNIQIIGDFADQSLVTIVYKGSKSQWEKVEGSEQDDLKDIVVFDA